MYKAIEYGPIKYHQYTADFIPEKQEVVGQNGFGKIIKQTDSRGDLPEIQYAYENNMFVHIRGHIKEDGKTFHLGSINNSPFIRRSIFNVPALLKFAEEDLSSQGIKKIETDCVKRLLNIATKRYGFIKSQESFLTFSSRLVYWVILNLRKRQGEKMEIGALLVKNI